MTPIEVSIEADRDIDDITEHYETVAGVQLADRFLAAIGAGLTHLSEYPKSGAIRFESLADLSELRVWPVRSFPYWMIYRESPDLVLVVRVLHTQRDIPGILGE